VHNALVGAGLRDDIRIGAAGKIITAFDIVRAMALGADWCNAARGFMFAVGCIQSQTCHTDKCPVGVATQDKSRQRALVVPEKAERVKNFHRATVTALAEVIAAAGLDHPDDIRPHHIQRRVAPNRVQSFAELYPELKVGELLAGSDDPRFKEHWRIADAGSFAAPLAKVETMAPQQPRAAAQPLARAPLPADLAGGSPGQGRPGMET
jgi:hypothetical protein